MELKENKVLTELSEHIISNRAFPDIQEVTISKRGFGKKYAIKQRLNKEINITKLMLKETKRQLRFLKMDLIILRLQKLSLLWRKQK